MKIIGLCGGSGSGKGAVAAILRRSGIPTLDTDALYHSMIAEDSPCSRDLIAAFGKSIATPDGGIDRSRLGALVFGTVGDEKRELLNTISHRHILKKCKEWALIQEQKESIAVCYDAPLLYESGLWRECDLTLAVLAPISLRTDRVCKRDGISAEKAEARIRTQLSDEHLRAKADLVIVNDGTPSELEARVSALLPVLLGYEPFSRNELKTQN